MKLFGVLPVSRASSTLFASINRTSVPDFPGDRMNRMSSNDYVTVTLL